MKNRDGIEALGRVSSVRALDRRRPGRNVWKKTYLAALGVDEEAQLDRHEDRSSGVSPLMKLKKK